MLGDFGWVGWCSCFFMWVRGMGRDAHTSYWRLVHFLKGCTCLKCTNRGWLGHFSTGWLGDFSTGWLVHLRQVHPLQVSPLGGVVTSAMLRCIASSKTFRASVTRSDVSKMDWLALGFSSRSNGITFRRILLRFTSLWRLVESVT